MPRLLASGSALHSPVRTESELKKIVSGLCNEHEFDDNSIHKYYFTLASIIGDWQSEQERLDTKLVKNAFLAMADNLSEASDLLGGLETGLRTGIQIAVASHIMNLMAIDPTIGSKDSAQKLLYTFRREAECISHVCRIAAADLPSRHDKRGAKQKDWYDKFTALLVSLAQKADLRPTLHGREAVPKGWLLDAARELESFLPKEMRCPSDVARRKRLERSKDNLRQNSLAR